MERKLRLNSIAAAEAELAEVLVVFQVAERQLGAAFATFVNFLIRFRLVHRLERLPIFFVELACHLSPMLFTGRASAVVRASVASRL